MRGTGPGAGAAEWTSQLDVAAHEILHALGFTESSFPLFRHADGSPRTPRDNVTGLPPVSGPPDGETDDTCWT